MSKWKDFLEQTMEWKSNKPVTPILRSSTGFTAALRDSGDLHLEDNSNGINRCFFIDEKDIEAFADFLHSFVSEHHPIPNKDSVDDSTEIIEKPVIEPKDRFGKKPAKKSVKSKKESLPYADDDAFQCDNINCHEYSSCLKGNCMKYSISLKRKICPDFIQEVK